MAEKHVKDAQHQYLSSLGNCKLKQQGDITTCLLELLKLKKKPNNTKC